MDNERAVDKKRSVGMRDADTSTWGPWLFRAVFLLSALFFWWLILYDHGVAPHHG